MNKTKNILLFGMIFFLYACNGDAKKNHQKNITAVQEQHINFDSVLKVCDYSWNDDYFMTPDYGILYNPQGTNLWGNISERTNMAREISF